MKLFKKKGQGWTVDYVISLLIFLIAAILATNILTNTLSTSDFENVKRSSITISKHLLSQGYPANWNSIDVLRIGLTSDKNRLSEFKLINFQDINYNQTRILFGIPQYQYAFYLLDNNGTIESVGTECALGSTLLTENKSFYQEMLPSAYYFRADTLMSAYMTPLGADNYDGNDNGDVDTFYQSLSNYNLVVMENPEIEQGGTLTVEQKKSYLEAYVQNGGVLFLSENVSVNFTGVNFTTNSSLGDSTVLSDSDPYLVFTIGREIDDNTGGNPSFHAVNLNAVDFFTLADYDATGEPTVARWRHGMGRVYYFATIDATYDPLGVNLFFNQKIGEGADNVVNVTRANCQALNFGDIISSDIARTERLVIRDSKIFRLVIVTWK